MANDHIQIPKGIKKKLDSAIENNKNIINLAKEEYRYFKYNEGKARRQLLYALLLAIVTNSSSVYSCYRDYGEFKLVYKSLYLCLLLEMISLILYLIPVAQRLYTIAKLEKNNNLLRNSLDRDKITKADLDKLIKTVSAIEKYNKKLSKDYLDVLERLPNNTIKRITTLRMTSDLNKSIRKFVKKAMSSINAEQRLDDKLGITANGVKGSKIRDDDKIKGIKNKNPEEKVGILQRIVRGIMGSNRIKTRTRITEMRASRSSRLGIISKLSRRSESLGNKIKTKEKEVQERNDTIREKLSEMDEFKYNPKQMDYLINKIENTPKREYNSKAEENSVKSSIKNQMREQTIEKSVEQRSTSGRQNELKSQGQMINKQGNLIKEKQETSLNNRLKNNNSDTIANLRTPDLNILKNIIEGAKNFVETVAKVDIDNDGKIGTEPIKKQNDNKQLKQNIKHSESELKAKSGENNNNKRNPFINSSDPMEDLKVFVSPKKYRVNSTSKLQQHANISEKVMTL